MLRQHGQSYPAPQGSSRTPSGIRRSAAYLSGLTMSSPKGRGTGTGRLSAPDLWIQSVFSFIGASPCANIRIKSPFLFKKTSSKMQRAAVIFDGLSLREVPAILKLAEDGGIPVREAAVSTAAAPSETLDFVEQRLRGGLSLMEMLTPWILLESMQ